jgi:peptidoglycan-N-acetylmuramic acid deacetylase
MSKIHNGAIILMHTVGQDNKEDLGLIIKELKSKGYKFSSLDELYNDF